MLGGVAGQAHRPLAESQQRPPLGRGGALGAERGDDVALDLPARLVEADGLRHLLDLLRPQPQRLAEVTHDPARAIGGEGGDQGRAVGAVDLVHARDQHLADVTREVEVDVRHRLDFVVEEAAGEEAVGDRVDVGEAGEVADDRADAGAAAAARRQDRAGVVAAADLGGDVAGQLQQLAVEEEEAGEAEPADRPQLLPEAGLGLGAVGVADGVALVEAGGADLGELAGGGGVAGARVAVAELLGEVEAEALGKANALGDGLGVGGEAGGHRGGRAQDRAGVAAPMRLGLGQRFPLPDRDEGVLEWARSRRWEWTLPVATQGTPRREASRASQRLRALSRRQ